jgi:hypothetical protein
VECLDRYWPRDLGDGRVFDVRGRDVAGSGSNRAASSMIFGKARQFMEDFGMFRKSHTRDAAEIIIMSCVIGLDYGKYTTIAPNISRR